ncbi:LCP family protein [Candidatus Peregrinibacteria bacterium]|nr:LCP family protein [Candidatus Peregrinibacteria bacterium]
MEDKVKRIKIFVLALSLALTIGLVGFGIRIKNLNADMFDKTETINSLAEEIGALRAENNYLNENLNAVNSTFIDLLNHTIKEKEKIENEMGQLMEIKTNLINSINQKDTAIQHLQEKNSQLEQTAKLEQVQNSDSLLNILILGEKDGLTDTIMLAVINKTNNSILLINIPRDLYFNGRKINSIYNSYGIEKLRQDIYQITNIYPEKYIVFSLDTFIKAVDILGGIDLYVRKAIYDEAYPAGNNGYMIYSISEGSHHLNGEEALKYVRSRKSTSDYDRSSRQQQVLQAVRVKLKTLDILSDLNKASELFTTIISNLNTNIDFFEALKYYEEYQNFVIKSGNVLSPENVLIATTSLDGQFILLPKNNDFYLIKYQISELIKK